MLDKAGLILDFPRGSTTPYTTAGGTVVSGDTDTVRSIECEKTPIGPTGRMVADSGLNSFRNNETDNIKDAGVVRMWPSANPFEPSGFDASDVIIPTKFWFVWTAFLHQHESPFSTALLSMGDLALRYEGAAGNARLTLWDGSSDNNHDVAMPNNNINVYGVYYDGTNLCIWVNDTTPAIEVASDPPVIMDTISIWSTSSFAINYHLSSLWMGLSDGDDSTQHKQDMSNLMAIQMDMEPPASPGISITPAISRNMDLLFDGELNKKLITIPFSDLEELPDVGVSQYQAINSICVMADFGEGEKAYKINSPLLRNMRRRNMMYVYKTTTGDAIRRVYIV
jgi:hypothetical protein